MSHYYCFTFIDNSNVGEVIHSSANIGLMYPKVSRKVIQAAKEVAGATPDSVLVCCAYLGEMTTEEFNAE
ncbi:hypothetical protein [Pseudomonas simiae]|uniref:hypothetical protein n=1 Tax=Pseudomonas simiae TaxID=321846 RepID=UPI0005DA35FA|nr:hypothetical protein [Pseudomonas simiae]AJZ97119.1 hypothetical protein PFLUOLIPICF7_15370 [Pseudomonas simiae]